MSVEALANRLEKNAGARRAWAKREGLTAFRLYDGDMPEWPLAIDAYAGLLHVIAYPRRKQLKAGVGELVAGVQQACAQGLQVATADVVVKVHEPRPWGEAPFEKAPGPTRLVTVEEYGRRFECNLTDFLDTGLFLDHRLTRRLVGRASQGARVLNLFAYTGSFTVHALAGGAVETTTVDLSNTYCAWAERNLALNGFATGPRHRVLRDDALAFLEHDRGEYDVIVADPPSFSASKKMGRRFEVQRDHAFLLERCLERLSPGGALYFSTNFVDFAPGPRLEGAEELTAKTLPADFRQRRHRCWRLGREGGGGPGPDRPSGAPRRR
ncbi:MAG: class I SAM-dependent methyltransferase [Myxococcaceae bacterium]|jgi:23S rRNA (cytosine1962-C5)-methyltransferase|nr:class I SAM-dependent methyltransferase [Myxococcaceae bacterium]MCA3015038.1 class I SAM-dependent methyltransferase [Myxococcaceae bacterium]